MLSRFPVQIQQLPINCRLRDRILIVSVADTLDLQDSDAPSAKDHTHQPSHPEPLGNGPAAPHQDAEMRHVEEERRAEEDYLAEAFNTGGFEHQGSDMFGLGAGSGSDMSGGPQSGMLDDGSTQQNGTEELESGDLDGEERAEEDSMDDKISSSPSIDDGGYSFGYTAPQNQVPASDRSSRFVEVLCRSLDVPYPLEVSHESPSPGYISPISDEHHLLGRYGDTSEDENMAFELFGNLPSTFQPRHVLRRVTAHLEPRYSAEVEYSPIQTMDAMFEDEGFGENLVPNEEVEDAVDVTGDSPSPNPSSSSSWTSSECLSLPFEWEKEDDATNDVFFSSNPRFIDSGWGGECLRETEDINFEFVYALHNFIATVEGQANATKGDTMVLLDDSNSYWWLVRVAKDNSIGKFGMISRLTEDI